MKYNIKIKNCKYICAGYKPSSLYINCYSNLPINNEYIFTFNLKIARYILKKLPSSIEEHYVRSEWKNYKAEIVKN